MGARADAGRRRSGHGSPRPPESGAPDLSVRSQYGHAEPRANSPACDDRYNIRMNLRSSRVHARAWMMLALVLVATCSPAPTGEAHDLVVSNETTLAVTIAVNGIALRTIQPQTQ